MGLVWGWDSSLPQYQSQICIHHMWVRNQPVPCLYPLPVKIDVFSLILSLSDFHSTWFLMVWVTLPVTLWYTSGGSSIFNYSFNEIVRRVEPCLPMRHLDKSIYKLLTWYVLVEEFQVRRTKPWTIETEYYGPSAKGQTGVSSHPQNSLNEGEARFPWGRTLVDCQKVTLLIFSNLLQRALPTGFYQVQSALGERK